MQTRFNHLLARRAPQTSTGNRVTALVVTCLLLALTGSPAMAQPAMAQEAGTAAPQTTAPAQNPAPATDVAGATAEAEVAGATAEPVALPPPALAAQCAPACQAGYICESGTCIPECNPPCPEGYACQAGSDCVATTPAAGPASAPAYPASQPQYPRLSAPAPAAAPAQHHAFSGNLTPGAEEHDGFMLRMSLGLGWSTAEFDNTRATDDLQAYGVASSFALDLGAAILPNFALHGRLATMVLPSPRYRSESAAFADDVGISAVMWAIGATYYIMPINLYLTGVVGVSTVSLSTAYSRGRSDAGLGLGLDVGKEWWVSDNWGLGIAIRLGLTSASFGDREDVVMPGLLAAFSATYQ